MTGQILIVDDTPANVRLLDAILTTHGHQVCSAASGTEALAVIESESPPDLVLLDIQMPGMNGFEVCRRIRANEALAMLPVIMITAAGGSEKLAALECGADDFIPRPFDQAELLARVRSLLRIKRYHDTIAGQAAELTAWNRVLEEQVSEQVEEVHHLQRLRRFLAAHVAEAVLSTGTDELLEPHRSEVAVVFSDLRGFTSFASTAEPEEVLYTLLDYHAAIGATVARYGATVGGFAGDGVMMFFNDPFPCDDPALRAVQATLEMREALIPVTQRWAERGHRLAAGFSISYGFATLGMIGFEGRYEYTAIGTVVNMGKRLCDVAAAGEILIGQRVFGAVQEFAEAEQLAPLQLRGFDAPVSVWRLDGLRADAGRAPIVEPDPAPPPPALPASGGRLVFRMLGPTRMLVDGVDVPLRAARLRHLLSLMLLHRNEISSVDRLVDELWEGRPPESATAALRVHVSRLRKVLAAVGHDDVLVTRPSGYQLDIAAESLDVARFEALAARGQRLLVEGKPEEAAESLDQALGLWQGRPLADVPNSPATDAAATRLSELHVTVLEDHIDAQLGCGRHRQILGELDALVRAHPLRERLWAQRMTALYRSGRQAEALAAYQALRRTLADELGLDPSPQLADLHDRILTRSAEPV
ncbi:MAG: adenylate cyclase [Pseudonocardiales bacterium]|nr:adenylate cyclase [Pseudonocardiales bacterium]